MAEVKVTKKDKFKMVKAFLEENKAPQVLIEAIDHEIALLVKKSANRQPTAKQKDNEVIKDRIVAVLKTVDRATVSELREMDATLGAENFQKINALLRRLRLEERVDRQEDNRTAYYFAM